MLHENVIKFGSMMPFSRYIWYLHVYLFWDYLIFETDHSQRILIIPESNLITLYTDYFGRHVSNFDGTSVDIHNFVSDAVEYIMWLDPYDIFITKIVWLYSEFSLHFALISNLLFKFKLIFLFFCWFLLIFIIILGIFSTTLLFIAQFFAIFIIVLVL